MAPGDDDSTEDPEGEDATALEVPHRRSLPPERTFVDHTMTPRTAVALDEVRYQVVDRLGRGGMGDVVAARDGVFGREIAIKRMLEPNPSSTEIDRFLREARIQGGLDHPAIPPVHELAIDSDGRPYFVMKRVAGTTLATVLSGYAENNEAIRDRYPRNRLLRAFAEVCLAVELAHTRGVIHRDLKPSNVMLGGLGEVYVLDWGVAKVVGDSDPVISEIRQQTAEAVTSAGAVIGTRGYMPPEQRDGVFDIDARADIFALGCVLFEILTIKKASVSSTRSPREAAKDRDVPPELDELCVSATEAERDKRLASARELGEGVQRYLDGDRDLEQRRELARAHLERARAAADDDADTAIREAGRALALDPQLPGAAELVGQLMIAPPKTISPELARSLDEARAEEQGRHATIGSRYGLLMYVPLMIALLLLEARPIWVVVTGVLSCAVLGTAVLGARHPRSGVLAYAAVGINALIIAIIARLFSPFLVAPSTAGLAVLIMVAGPMFRSRSIVIVIAVTFSLAVLMPWVVEAIGLIEPTTVFLDGGLELHPVELAAGRTQFSVGLVIYGPMVVILSTVAALALARNQEADRRQLQLQTWRLRQLVS